MKPSHWLSALIASAVVVTPASGCFCFPTPMCAQIATLSKKDAVFVAKVIDVWPSREVIAAQSEAPLTLAQRKRLILRRWHGALTPEEERKLRAATNRDAIDSQLESMQRVRFVVTEQLIGPKLREAYTET